MTATELAVAEQMPDLREISQKRGWPLREIDSLRFVIGLPAKDNSWYWLLVDCLDFPQQPPAFNWYNPDTEALNQAPNMPRGSGYFNNTGRFCAPWNRLAYKQFDPQGPHGDWDLASWLTNPHTGGTTTLAAMVLRIYREIRGPNYQGRMG